MNRYKRKAIIGIPQKLAEFNKNIFFCQIKLFPYFSTYLNDNYELLCLNVNMSLKYVGEFPNLHLSSRRYEFYVKYKKSYLIKLAAENSCEIF